MTMSDDLYNEILASGPSSGTLFLVLSRLKEEGQGQRVIQECIKALGFDPGAIQIRRLLAETFFEAGLISQAETELEKVSREIHDLIPVYKLQSEIYRRQKRVKEAAAALSIYTAHRPEDREAQDLLDELVPPVEAFTVTEGIAAPPGESPDQEPDIPEQAGLPDIATATLAEVYFNQGQIREAAETYEKVVAKNPDDEKARERLEQIRAMVVPEPPAEDIEARKRRVNNEKMIALLEAWLTNIRKMSETSAPA